MRTVVGPVASAPVILLNWPSCGLANFGSVMRRML
jgi:hypothetical protein